MLKDFAWNAGEGYGSVVGSGSSVVFLVNGDYVCFQPVGGRGSGVEGYLKYCRQYGG